MEKLEKLFENGLEERIIILEEKVDIVINDIKEMAKVSNNALKNKIEELTVLLKDENDG